MQTLLPELQTLALTVLAEGSGWRAGRDIRDELTKKAGMRSLPSFYRLMGRLEKDELVKGRYQEKETSGRRISFREYQITSQGRRAMKHALSFWIQRAQDIGLLKENVAVTVRSGRKYR